MRKADAPSGGPHQLFSEAMEEFLRYMASIERSPETIRSYREHFLDFLRYLEEQTNAPVYLQQVTSENLEGYLCYLKDRRNYQPSSRAHVLNAHRSLFKFATKRQWVQQNITLLVDPISLAHKERVYLTQAEMDQFIPAIDSPLIRRVAQCLTQTGLRISECLSLTLETVDLENRQIHVLAGKGNKDRTVPISDKLYEQLTHYLHEERPLRTSNRFFATKQSGRLSRASVNGAFQRATQRLGWEKHVTAHILRHSFASALLKNGVGLLQVQKLLGHASLTVTSVYTHSSLEDLTKAVNQF
ncbi:recombinase [Alicyclobacillaceae bacterium I2511]|nr:recombinase [Alicyclobacillaceae bacterium I2511]